MRTRQATCEQLREAVAAQCGQRSRAARRAADYVRERVDSPMESRLRVLLVLAGIPAPEVNLCVRDADGEPLRRYDLSWPTSDDGSARVRNRARCTA